MEEVPTSQNESQHATQPTQLNEDVLRGEDDDENAPVDYGNLVPIHAGLGLERLFLTPETESLTFGRHHACDVVLKNNLISNLHCRITVVDPDTLSLDSQAPNVFIEDLSSNGTFIRNKLLGKGNKTILCSGDDISLGSEVKHTADETTICYIFHQRKPRERNENEVDIKYDLRDVVGGGNFSVVKYAVNRTTGKHYACKIIDKAKHVGHKNILRSFEREISILKKLDHPHVVRLFDYYEDQRTIWLIMELMGDNLSKFMNDRIFNGNILTESQVQDISRQICEAVQYLHGKNIAHRDLKPDNIMLTVSGGTFVKVTDFGLAKAEGNKTSLKTMCGTPSFLAPEIITGSDEAYSLAVDIWSLGVSAYYMIANTLPFIDSTNDPLFRSILQGEVNLEPIKARNFSDAALDFVMKCLVVDSRNRMTADEALNHPWLKVQVSADEALVAPSRLLVSSKSEISMELESEIHDASQPPASSGITKFFEKNEFFSSPAELVTSAGSSNVDSSNADQAQHKKGTRKRVVPEESAEPERRVTRAQSRRAYSDPGTTSSPATSSKKRHADDISPDSSEDGSTSTQTLPTLSMETWDREADEYNAKDVTIDMELDQVGQATDDALDQTGRATNDTEDILVKEGADIKGKQPELSAPYLLGENTDAHIDLKAKEELHNTENLPWGVLMVVPGSKEGVDIGIWSDSLTIGRSASCDAKAVDQRCSSKHCIFRREGEKYFIKDTSANGVYLGEERIEKNVEKEIKDGQIVSVIRNITDDRDYIKFQFRTELKYRAQFISNPSHAQMSPTALWRVKSPRNRIAADGGKNACGSSHQERSPKIRRRTIDDNDAQTSACINNVLVRPWGRLNTINTEYKTAWLTDDITFFGRQQDCHGELTYVSSQPDHKKISAHHCAIIKKDDDAFIQDLGMNGTFLNGDRLPPRVLYMLKDGDEIVLSYADDQSDLRQKGACDRHGRLVHIGYIFQFTTRTI